MRQVLVLLTFNRSIKEPNLHVYLATLEKLATYFYTCNRLNYAQNNLEFVAKAYAARDDSPEL